MQDAAGEMMENGSLRARFMKESRLVIICKPKNHHEKRTCEIT